MPAKAPVMKPDVNSVLKRIEGDIHEFERALQRAEASVDKDDHEKCQADLEVISVINNRLQEHRAEIRKWSTKLDAREKTRFGAARAQIEQELRKYKALTVKFQPKVPAKAPPGNEGTELTVVAEVEAQPQPAQVEVEASPGPVKVLVEQLLMDGSEEKSEMTEEFVCKICLVHFVGHRPTLTSCSHLFCGDCLEKWFALQPGALSWAHRACSTGTVPCPVCKESLSAQRDLYPVGPEGPGGSALLWQMLSDLPIVCSNHPKCNPKGRCDWRGTYGSFQDHIRECKNMPMFSASTSPTVTPDFTPSTSHMDENLECIQLDTTSQDESFASEPEEPHPSSRPLTPKTSSNTVLVDMSSPTEAAEDKDEQPKEQEGEQEEVATCEKTEKQLEETVAPAGEANAEEEVEEAEKEGGRGEDEGQDDCAGQTAVQPHCSPPVPGAGAGTPPSGMTDLTSLIGALFELKLQERMQGQQPPSTLPAAGGAATVGGSATTPISVPEAAPARAVAPAYQELPAPAPQAGKNQRQRAKHEQAARVASGPTQQPQAARVAQAAQMQQKPRIQSQPQAANAATAAQMQMQLDQWNMQWRMAQAQAAQWQQWEAAMSTSQVSQPRELQRQAPSAPAPARARGAAARR